MGLRAGLYFKIDEAKHTVTATVTIYRDKDLTDKIYSDSLIIDLRYDIPVKTEVTATRKRHNGNVICVTLRSTAAAYRDRKTKMKLEE